MIRFHINFIYILYIFGRQVANPDIVNESGVFNATYLQSITKSFSLGGEIMYQYEGGMDMAMMGFGFRYKSDKTILAGEISPNGTVGAAYMHRVNEKV